ncbi:MAG: hypothetical protein GJV46_04260 [Geobacter sp.]|nr:hypothetical protein [Geobacter sp.]
MPLPTHPILVVSYSDDTRAALAAQLSSFNAASVACSSFCQAEELALRGFYSGLLTDVSSIVRSKGEEKNVAYTLANFFPTLRVRTPGTEALEAADIPRSARHDKSLVNFLNKSCPAFTPRTLRAYRRHLACLSTVVAHNGKEYRGFTLNLAWGGAFVVDIFPEKYSQQSEIILRLPEFGLDIEATIRWIKPWGERSAPGIGISFNRLDQPLESVLADLLKSQKEFDRDRLLS